MRAPQGIARNASDLLVMLDARSVERMPTRQKLKRPVELAFLANAAGIIGTVISQRTVFLRSVSRHIASLTEITRHTANLNDVSLRNVITTGDPWLELRRRLSRVGTSVRATIVTLAILLDVRATCQKPLVPL